MGHITKVYSLGKFVSILFFILFVCSLSLVRLWNFQIDNNTKRHRNNESMGMKSKVIHLRNGITGKTPH